MTAQTGLPVSLPVLEPPVGPVSGEGQYGKVYTCISVDTGELMAMKEVSACISGKNVPTASRAPVV